MPYQPSPPTPSPASTPKGSNLKSKPLAIEESDAYKFLRGLNEFSSLPKNDLQSLASSARFSDLDAGQYITIEGDEESLYGFIVATGSLAMLKTSPNGKELIVELLQSGDIFGMLVMLAAEKLPSQLSARALQSSKVLWVPISEFMRLLGSHPVLFKEFTAHLLLCLQSSYRLSRGLAHDRVEVRIAAVLTSLALKFGKRAPGDESNTIKFTRQQIADLTGTTPETAIRVTRAMQRNGHIDIKRPGIIRILDLKALEALVEG